MPKPGSIYRRRIVAERRAGISDKTAPYWQGQRAEQVVAARVAERATVKAGRRTASPRGARGEKTPHQVLRRLERTLARRKTLAGRQRVKARIAALKRELGC